MWWGIKRPRKLTHEEYVRRVAQEVANVLARGDPEAHNVQIVEDVDELKEIFTEALKILKERQKK